MMLCGNSCSSSFFLWSLMQTMAMSHGQNRSTRKRTGAGIDSARVPCRHVARHHDNCNAIICICAAHYALAPSLLLTCSSSHASPCSWCVDIDGSQPAVCSSTIRTHLQPGVRIAPHKNPVTPHYMRTNCARARASPVRTGTSGPPRGGGTVGSAAGHGQRFGRLVYPT